MIVWHKYQSQEPHKLLDEYIKGSGMNPIYFLDTFVLESQNIIEKYTTAKKEDRKSGKWNKISRFPGLRKVLNLMSMWAALDKWFWKSIHCLSL